MKIIFFLVLALCAVSLGYQHGVGLADKMDGSCFKEQDVKFINLAGSSYTGIVNPYLSDNLQQCKDNDLKCFVMIIPAILVIPAETQITELCNAIKKVDYHTQALITIGDATQWKTNKNANRDYVATLIAQLGAHPDCLGFAGFSATKNYWNHALGADFSGYSHKYLLYRNWGSPANFNDFKAFGGWKKADEKSYKIDGTMCSITVQLNIAYNALPPTSRNATIAD